MSEEEAPASIDACQADAMGYLALHGTDLARALAGGAIFPRKEDWPAFAMAASRGEVGPAIEGARRGRDYGVVALVEAKQGHLDALAGHGAARGRHSQYLPLAMISRIVFESDEDVEEFRARASGYVDVPASVVPYHVEPGLFGSRHAASLLDQDRQAKHAGLALTDDVLAAVDAIDKLAGTISACLMGATRAQGEGSCLQVLVHACGRLEGPAGVGDLVGALALELDHDAENAIYASIASRAAEAIARIAPGDGFDADAFLDELAAMLPQGSKEAARAMELAGWASGVVSGSTDVADDGFADCPGKTVARALLLFLLNPDATRLQSVGRRLGVLGPSVHMLACAFAGGLAGFAGLPAALKAWDMQRYLAVPLLARSLAHGESTPLSDVLSLAEIGAGESSVTDEPCQLLSTSMPAPP